MRFLKQSTSVDRGIGPFLDETDGKTAETALTITQPDIRLKKNNGAWAQKNAAQTLTHEENGWYEVTLDATDTNTIGELLVAVHEAGALPVWAEFHVLAPNVYDSLFGDATDKLQVDLVESLGVAVTSSDGTATAGAASTITLQAGSANTANYWRHQVIRITAGTGAGQSRVILSSSTASPPVLTVDKPWVTNPDSTSQYIFEGHVDSALARAVNTIVEGTVGSGSTTTSIVCSDVEPDAGAADSWRGLILKFADDTTTAALRGQGSDITASTSGATPTLTVTALTTAPVSGDRFVIQ